jgi:putative tricarboxylic transport membrane protein
MKRPYQVTALVFLVSSFFIARESLRLRFYTELGPGPGYFPFWLSILLALLAAAMLYQATFRCSDPLPADFFPTRSGYLRIAAVLGSFAFAIIAMDVLGFRLVMLSFFVFLLSALGRQNPLITALVALAGSFGAYQIFEGWLKIPLPIGMFGI